MSLTINEESTVSGSVNWIRISEKNLAGEGMGPYNMHELVALVTWVENPEAGAEHFVPYHGQFLVDIVVTEPNAVDIPSKTGDEFILVLKGALSLTTHATKVEQKFVKGERVMIPGGWTGIFRALPEDDGCYSELAIVPGDYYDKSTAPAANELSPFRINFPAEPGIHVVHDGRYVMEVENSGAAHTEAKKTAVDEVIQVNGGTLTLEIPGTTETFQAGAVVILPAGFEGVRTVSANYQALVTRAKA